MLSKLLLEAYSQAVKKFWSLPGYNVPNCPNHLILASLFEDILPSNILPDHNGCVKPFQICQSLLIWNNEKKWATVPPRNPSVHTRCATLRQICLQTLIWKGEKNEVTLERRAPRELLHMVVSFSQGNPIITRYLHETLRNLHDL